MTNPSPSRGLYLITPPQLSDIEGFSRELARALDVGGVVALQLRLKSPDGSAASPDMVVTAAAQIAPVCRAHGVAFLLNDDPRLARAIGADGVHIGQSDTPYAVARDVMGDQATVGVTCHASMHLAMEAGEAGADYVAFGAFFPTATKDAPTVAPLELLEDWTTATTVACVAIGGITPENCGPLLAAGADYVAASAGVWRDPDGAAAAVRRFNEAFARHG